MSGYGREYQFEAPALLRRIAQALVRDLLRSDSIATASVEEGPGPNAWRITIAHGSLFCGQVVSLDDLGSHALDDVDRVIAVVLRLIDTLQEGCPHA